jgi:hypothetical protein
MGVTDCLFEVLFGSLCAVRAQKAGLIFVNTLSDTIHMISAYASSNKLVLGQIKTEYKLSGI